MADQRVAGYLEVKNEQGERHKVPIMENNGDEQNEDKINKETKTTSYNSYLLYGSIACLTLAGIAGFVYLYQKLEDHNRQIKSLSSDASQISPIPSGTIAIWKGGEIPKGWTLCDGNGGSPDLVSKGIYGAGPGINKDRSVPYDCKVSFDNQQINTSVNFIMKTQE